MRRPSVAIAAVILLLAIAAVASAGPRDAELGRLAADGPVTLSSNHPGVALLRADRLKPGDQVSGLVSLSNTGDLPGDLALGVSGRRDSPGRYGGRLSSVMMLRIEDLSGRTPARQSVIERASTFALGRLSGRETRTYRVTASFPDGGRPASPLVGDNLLQGSSVELALKWQLTAADPIPVTPPATPPASPGSPAAPAQPAGNGSQLLLTLRVPNQRVLKPRGLKAFAKCVIACKVRFTASTDSAKRKKGKRFKTLQRKRVLKGERKWRKLRAGREKRFVLQLPPKARKKLERQLRGRGSAGITITASMRSAAGTRTVKRRIVVRSYKATGPR